jgi:hypothetical protein
MLPLAIQHMINPIKGWPSGKALDFSAPISPGLLYTLQAGQVCHLNSSGQYEPGVVAWQMGHFMIQGATSLDVNTTPGPLSQWYVVTPGGNPSSLVATGSLELQSTEYDQTQTYALNQPLRAPTGLAANQAGISGTLTNQGVLTWVDYITANTNLPTAIVGIVSRAPVANANGVKMISFWPVWFPGHPNQTV